MALSIFHRGHELSKQQLDAANQVLVEGMNRGWSTKKLEKAVDAALEAAGCPAPPRPVNVGQNRNRKQFKLTCVGGPWGGQEVVFPEQDDTPLSLPIRVGEHVGRYNLNTGAWVPMEQKA